MHQVQACPAALGAALVLAAAACDRSPPPRLNLVVVLADTLRADHLGFHGYERPTSPHLDRLARQSVVFHEQRSHAPRTGPSVATLFTGRHVRSHGAVDPIDRFDGKGTLPAARTTLAEILAAHGWRCRAVVANPNVAARYGFAQGFEEYREFPPSTPARELREVATEWLAALPEPFFLYLHAMEPHSPYAARPDPPFADPAYAGPLRGTHAELDRIVAGELTPDAADRQHLVDLYDQEIAVLDREVGLLVDELERRALLERTAFVFLSDHGEELFDHGSVLHGYTLYEEQLHVPFLMRVPGWRPAAVARPSRHVDVLPTLLEALGLPPRPEAEGRSLAVTAAGGRASPRPLLAEASLHAVKTIQATAFEQDGWKVVETRVPPDQPPQLFHLAEDPREQRDLAAENPERLAAMQEALRRFLSGLPLAEPETRTLSAEEMEALRALGYGDRE